MSFARNRCTSNRTLAAAYVLGLGVTFAGGDERDVDGVLNVHGGRGCHVRDLDHAARRVLVDSVRLAVERLVRLAGADGRMFAGFLMQCGV